MHKIVTLAVLVSVIPLSQRVFKKEHLTASNDCIELNTFRFKSNFPSLLEPPPKSTENYSQDCLSKAQENIRKSEYNFKWEEKLRAYCTPNRKNNLRFFYNDNGFAVEPRTTQIPIGDFDHKTRADEIKYRTLSNWKVKFKLDKKQIGKGAWQITENKAEYITDNITVQYINNDEGMRQNFIVNTPLSNDDKLKINFSIKTSLKTVLINNNLHFNHKKNTVLHYEGLRVWDADGKQLTAFIKKIKKNKYAIEVNTTGAIFPVTIDPISTTPAATVESNNANALMGTSVASAGDVNGDGYSDVIIGAYFYNNGQSAEGAFFVYHGSATGISTTPALMVESDQAFIQMGYSVASAGDVNGDGYSDVIVGAALYSNGQTSEGAFYIYHGSASGLNSTPASFVESNLTGSCRLGFSVACAGDVNGDAYSDVIVGANGYTIGQSNEGAFYIFHGSSTGISLTPALIVESNIASAQLGWSVASAGDVNGDGYSDVIVGASRYANSQSSEGAFYVYHGSASGISSTPISIVESNNANAEMGASVASAGDVNGDGYSDVIVGAPGYSNGEVGEGAIFLFNGSASGINTTPVNTIESNQVNAFFGYSVACSGDINADGYSDVAVVFNRYSNGETNEGATFLYSGSLTGINTIPIAILETNQASANLSSVASAGDVNGDGYSDIIAGANNYSNGQSGEGGAFVYHGSAAGLSTIPNNTPDDADQANASFGRSVSSAGDVNGDGYGDVIIGAPNFDDGVNADEGRAFVYYGSATGLSANPNSIPDDADQASTFFGYAVASAGDVNGDGYGDIIIGAPNYDDGANANEGRAFVYHGSAAGLSVSPSGTPDDADQAAAAFGLSVSPAGDVNGDGYSDVIIGAPNYDDGANTNEGRAFVYYGSSTGLSASPNSTPDDANQLNATFGTSVSLAGDVNGDGYSDVIIGANQYDDGANTNEGGAFVYYGSATGLAASPSALIASADQIAANFGTAVASAGDVNGDGYSDVIIGANLYDDGVNTDEGRAFVHYGSAAGLSTTPGAVPDDADLANAHFGFKIAGAGDVNGDGYSDIIVGAQLYTDGANTQEGRVFIYHGSAIGLSAAPNSIHGDADQSTAWFSSGVASAGDLNGDGYSDIIIGSLFYDDGANNNEGRAFVYNGNESTNNKRNNLHLYNSNLTTPINSSNFVFGNFGAGLYAKSFLGRAKGKLVWETRLNYNAYSGVPITNSALFTAQQAAYTDMELAGIELKNIITKLLGGKYTKLRARIKYDPVTAITGQVYSPWRNVSSIIDANNLGILPIELISFNAAWLQKGKTARLDFKTDRENGICCFDIEKSADGFNFYSIGTVPAKNISGIQSYSFIDANATGKNQFYCLKIKGIAGQLDYSNIQQLQNDKATEILVFPNPTTDALQLHLNKVYDKMQVQIINSAGQMVKKLIVASYSQSIKIAVQDLAAGKYWLQLQSGSERQVVQFVKQQ
ncbi:MAG: FG-GAP repeat protein [Chitinophagaceae bacterium]|nr:FG-GAP repeat protein [Chitinophagaceae bacterium]